MGYIFQECLAQRRTDSITSQRNFSMFDLITFSRHQLQFEFSSNQNLNYNQTPVLINQWWNLPEIFQAFLKDQPSLIKVIKSQSFFVCLVSRSKRMHKVTNLSKKIWDEHYLKGFSKFSMYHLISK